MVEEGAGRGTWGVGCNVVGGGRPPNVQLGIRQNRYVWGRRKKL